MESIFLSCPKTFISPLYPQSPPPSGFGSLHRNTARLPRSGPKPGARLLAMEHDKLLHKSAGQPERNGDGEEEEEGRGDESAMEEEELLEGLEEAAMAGKDEGRDAVDYDRRAHIFEESSRVFQALKERTAGDDRRSDGERLQCGSVDQKYTAGE